MFAEFEPSKTTAESVSFFGFDWLIGTDQRSANCGFSLLFTYQRICGSSTLGFVADAMAFSLAETASVSGTLNVTPEYGFAEAGFGAAGAAGWCGRRSLRRDSGHRVFR